MYLLFFFRYIMSDVTLFKPNELLAAIDQIQVNRTAKHLCNYFLQYAQHEIKFNNHKSNKFELNIAELNAEAQIGLKDYKLIEKSLKALMQPVTIRNADNPRNFSCLVPIYRVDVNTIEGKYIFKLEEDVIELLRVTDIFTKLNLHEFNFLDSKHSIVIYEWLKRYENAPQIPVLTVEELRNITHTSDKKTYDNFAHLQQKVLDVAVNEISEKTPYTVTYEPIKTRTIRRPKVSALQFTMTKKKSAEQLAGKSGIVSPEIISVHQRYQALCEQYIKFNFCNTSKEFYQATYVADYSLLTWFYNAKKDLQQANKLKWLLDDIEKGKRYPRRANQTAYYKSLFDKEDSQTQGMLEYGRSQQGFLEQVLKLQIKHNDNKQIDIEKWL